jgi:hypothetical protein
MAQAGNVSWHVVPNGQRLTTQISPNGTGFTDVWEVTYMIDSGPAMGTEGTVRIPQSQYSTEIVKAAINAQVATQHGIASL